MWIPHTTDVGRKARDRHRIARRKRKRENDYLHLSLSLSPCASRLSLPCDHRNLYPMTGNWLLIRNSSPLLLSSLPRHHHHPSKKLDTCVFEGEKGNPHAEWVVNFHRNIDKNHVILVNIYKSNQQPLSHFAHYNQQPHEVRIVLFYNFNLRRPTRTSALINGRINLFFGQKGVIFPHSLLFPQPSHHP